MGIGYFRHGKVLRWK